MTYRTLELTLISAKDLKDVNLIHKMEVYAEVVLSTDPRSKQRTLTDQEGTKNPTWNSTLKFTVPADTGATGTFHVMLRTERALGDREVGEVHIPLKEILATATGDGPTETKFVSYQVWKPCGKPKGVLSVSYKLGERFTAPSCPASANAGGLGYPPATKPAKNGSSGVASYQPPPPTATGPPYQPPPAAATGPYPPPPAGYPTPGPGPAVPITAYPAATGAPAGYPAPPPYSYAPPPQYGYGPPPPQPGYGYPPYGYPPAAQAPPAKPKKNKNKNNYGLGAGLIGGAIGGLILGDIVADAAEDSYDSGYDAGFDDAGGFDF